MDKALQIIENFQARMNEFPWVQRIRPHGDLLFWGGFALVIINRLLIHNGLLYSLGLYAFLVGAIIQLLNEKYMGLVQGFVAFSMYKFLFSCLDIDFIVQAHQFPDINFSGLIDSAVYLAIAVFFYKINQLRNSK